MNNNGLSENRRQIHVRRITCIAYERGDGLWDIEGSLIDTKPTGATLIERGVIPPDEAVHEMTIRLTIDQTLTIRQATASTIHSPYAVCGAINDAYGQLAGIRISPGFTQTVKRLFKGVAGCSHLTELLPPLATTALQSLWGNSIRIGDDKFLSENDSRSMASPVDGCHALRIDGDIIRKYFPTLYKGVSAP